MILSENHGKSITTKKKVTYFIIITLFSVTILISIAEFITRMIVPEVKTTGNLTNIAHPILGWIPKPNTTGTANSPEFNATYLINSLGLNDEPIGASNKAKRRIVALGDSHTFALGVDMEQAWPNQLERLLFKGDTREGAVFNLGVIGYSLGQYLQRMQILEHELKPHIVIIGFSMATDLYDLVPPDRGGFVYGAEYDREYYDLDKNGLLVKKNSALSKSTRQKRNLESNQYAQDVSLTIRGFLQKFSVYRALKRSKLATWVALHIRPGGSSLWPGQETALKKQLGEEESYRWRLAEAILSEIASHARNRKTHVILVNIPYLAQVYDEVWDSSFGMYPSHYDRWIAGQRLSAICGRLEIICVDTTSAFVKEFRKNKTWLHYKYDGHPTSKGHSLIAQRVYNEIVDNNLLYKLH